MSTELRPACRLCGHRDHWLGDHLVEKHDVSIETYLSTFPSAPLASAEATQAVSRTLPALSAVAHPPPPQSLRIVFAGATVPVNYDVPEDACLPLPEAYRVPQHGQLATDVAEVVIYLLRHRPTYIWGPQGTGKDAVVHAFSAHARIPGLLFQVEPGADIRAWFFSHEFNKDGTFWKEGDLLKALRDGYLTPTGRRVPYLILITDFDRATKEQAESLRLVLDSISGRVKGPAGVTYTVMPGTTIVVTANTAGGGDATGRYVSANTMDSSILDRFERAIKFHMMDWLDEEVVVRAKFPTLVERCPDVFRQVGAATKALRAATQAEILYAEFSHRGVCSWLGAASDLVEALDDVPKNLLTRAFRVVQDKMPDPDTSDTAWRTVDSHIKGGVLPSSGSNVGMREKGK
jgi:MoxR-like ATPase